MNYQEAANILGIDLISITSDGLKRAYRRMSLKYHPDCNSSPDANEKVRNIIDAYNTLREYLTHQEEMYMDIPGCWLLSSTTQKQLYLIYIIRHINKYNIIYEDCTCGYPSFSIVPKTIQADPFLQEHYKLRDDCIPLCVFGGQYQIGHMVVTRMEEFNLVDKLYTICAAKCPKTQQYTHTVPTVNVNELDEIFENIFQDLYEKIRSKQR